MVPVVSRECGIDIEDCGFYLEQCNINRIQDVVKYVSVLPVDRLSSLSAIALNEVETKYSEEIFRNSFATAISQTIQCKKETRCNAS
jgi:hypothetical protein